MTCCAVTLAFVAGSGAELPYTMIQSAYAQQTLDDVGVPSPPMLTATDTDRVAIIETDMGTITIEFFSDDAPGHVANFIKLSESGFYDNTLFHRIIPGFMIQGGDPNTIDGESNTWGTGGPGYTVPAEFNDIMHDRGIVSMARSNDPNSAGSQFFIVHQNSHFLDGQYTVFGRVITDVGFQTLDAIAGVPTGVQDRPVDPEQVRILNIMITDRSEITSDVLNLDAPSRTNMPMMPTPTSGDQPFESERLGISFVAPAGWMLQEPGITQPEAPDVVAVGPQQGGGIPQIYIYVDATNQTSLDDVVDERVATIQGILSEDDFATLLQGESTISGLDAQTLEVTESVSLNNRTIDVKLVEAIAYYDGTAYTISYANLPHVFDEDLPHFENVLDTFDVHAAPDVQKEEEEEEIQTETPVDAVENEKEDEMQIETPADDSGDGGGVSDRNCSVWL